jgi:glycosyltransferase involved in cell wall biosynthesis
MMKDIEMSYAEAEPADLVPEPVAAVNAASRPENAPSRLRGKRIAIVHDWLDTFAGSECVLEQLLICFPTADVFTLVDFLKPEDRRFLEGRVVKTSFIQRLPGAKRIFRAYLGLMPLAIEQFDMSGYDLIISSSHAVAKGVVTGPDQVHISYVHSPMRYIWDLQHQYLKQSGLNWGPKALYIRWLFGRLRQWDVSSAQHVDYFIANSSYIGRRLKKAYARDATVIHPPVDIERFAIGTRKDDFFLLVARLVPYKRADLIVETFRMQPDRKLIVVGDGPEAARVRAAARGASNIEFRSKVAKPELIDLMQRARAALFAAEEDFGITMVEVQACGTPVIAFERGGVTDIIDADGVAATGVLFDRQEVDAVADALARFDSVRHRISAESCRANALRFARSRFRAEIRSFVEIALG